MYMDVKSFFLRQIFPGQSPAQRGGHPSWIRHLSITEAIAQQRGGRDPIVMRRAHESLPGSQWQHESRINRLGWCVKEKQRRSY
jgi:hypothetical protein